MQDLTQFILGGLTTGAIYAVVALGFTLIYNASDVINFAQGEFVMIGGLTAAVLHEMGVGMFPAALIAILAAGIVGALVYELAIRPARTSDPVTIIILTIGISIFIKGIAQIVFDKQFHALPYFSSTTPMHVFGASFTSQMVWVMGGVAIMMTLLYVFLRFSLVGRSLIAMSANRLAATIIGVNVRRSLLLSFVLSALIGAVGGVLVTPITTTAFDAGAFLALKGFAAAVFGGLGSTPGAVLGGLILGILESLAAGYITSTYKDAVAYLLIILIMLLFPSGILNFKRFDRV
jgi:branched-chain amino acid transport system permease protein